MNAVAGRLPLLVLVLFAATPAAGARQASSFQDLLTRLADAPAELRAPAINHYLNLAGSAPLIEGDTVVFLAEGDPGRPPRIVGDFNAWGKDTPPDPAFSGTMTRIEGTEWYYARMRVDRGARIQYLIARGDRQELDPLNPRMVEDSGEKRSEVWVPK
jgi:hypothetical protein